MGKAEKPTPSKPTLASLFNGYHDQKERHLKRNWLNLRGLWRRGFQPTPEFARLMEENAKFQTAFSEWLIGVFILNEVSKSDAELLRMKAKNFKEATLGRSNFLVIFAALLAIVSFNVTDGWTLSVKLLLSIFALSSLVERHHCVQKASIAEEIANHIDFWLKTSCPKD